MDVEGSAANDFETDWKRAVPIDDARKRRVLRERLQEANPSVLPKLYPLAPISLVGKQPPERRWIVPGWIPLGTVTMLAGDGGVGKSLLMLQLMTAVATGRKWLGQEVMPCKTLGVFCEDEGDELHRRQAQINEHHGIDFGDLEDIEWHPRVGEVNALMQWDKFETAGEPTQFFYAIHNACQDFGAQLIVLDSLHDLFTGNENSRPHARQFIHLLASLARDCEAAVVLCSHPSVAGRNTGSGESGSTAWNNAVRSRLFLTRPKEEDDDGSDDARVLRKMKANYSSINDEIKLRWHNGVFAPEVVLGGAVGAIEGRAADQVFLQLLTSIEREGRAVSESRNAGNYAPKVFASRPERAGFTKEDFRRAMERLFSMGEIQLVEYGRPGDRRRKIARKEVA